PLFHKQRRSPDQGDETGLLTNWPASAAAQRRSIISNQLVPAPLEGLFFGELNWMQFRGSALPAESHSQVSVGVRSIALRSAVRAIKTPSRAHYTGERKIRIYLA